MDAFEAILTRRSVRRFLNKPLPEDVVQNILRAAMNAPSAVNQQPWHFIVISEESLRQEIANFSPNARMIKDAPLGILVCGDIDREKYPEYKFWIQDCAAATQNILLAAFTFGIGSVWTAVYPVEPRMNRYRELLALPDNIMPFSLVPLGYPAEKAIFSDRFDEKKVHYEVWQGKSF